MTAIDRHLLLMRVSVRGRDLQDHGPAFPSFANVPSHEKVKVGQDVALISSPTVEPNAPMGIIPSVLTVGNVARYWAGDMVAAIASAHGSSGGALAGADGRVVGILVAETGEGTGLFAAVPVSVLAAFLASR